MTQEEQDNMVGAMQMASMDDSLRPPSLMNHQVLHDRLRQLFTTGFSAMDIAEPLLWFDAEKSAVEVKGSLEIQQVKVAGILTQGQAAGFVLRTELVGESCLDCMHGFGSETTVPQSASYQEVIEALDRADRCFVIFLGKVAAVIQKKDITKPSVRMWLFGLITIAEMNISHMVERLYPDGSWQKQLSQERLAKSQALREERQRKGQDLSLMDCLYLADKARILTKEPSIREDMGFDSRKEAKKAISQLESLRNSLAHAHDIVTYDWTAIVEMSRRLDRMLSRL